MSRLSARLPASLRRLGNIVRTDVASLPGRLHHPDRRRDPWALLHHDIGGGDYRAVGEQVFEQLRRHGGLRAQDRVLDIGCGTGRVARPLAGFLAPRAAGGAAYLGFDISARAVRYCQGAIGARRRDFVFAHLDVANHAYNRGGAVEEAAAVFPCADGAADVAFAASVFTHMRLSSVERYVAQAARTLAPGGRLLFTAYALDGDSLTALDRGETKLAFVPWGPDGSRTVSPEAPELAVAHDIARLHALARAAGLEVTAVLRGGWRPHSDYDGYQDLFVVEKR